MKKKDEIKLLPCYEHWFRQWAKFYKEHKWVQQENGRWIFVKWEKTKLDLLDPSFQLFSHYFCSYVDFFT